MYSKEEKKQLNQAFWTAFGSYMKPCFSQFGKKVNWSNYKTGLRQIYARFVVDHKYYEFKIEIQDKDDMIRSLFYEQFEELKPVLENEFGSTMEWTPNSENSFHEVSSKIFISNDQLNYHNKAHWGDLFSMMQTHIIAFDRFWYDWKDTFVELAR